MRHHSIALQYHRLALRYRFDTSCLSCGAFPLRLLSKLIRLDMIAIRSLPSLGQ